MAKFQVTVPPSDPDGFEVTLTVDAASWQGALRAALTKIGESQVKSITCDVQDDGSFKITDSESSRSFLVKNVDGATSAAPAADLKKAEEAKKAEEQKRADEAKRADEQRRAEEQKAEEQRRAEEAKKAEEAKRADEQRRAEEAKRAEETKRAESKKAEEQKRADEQRRAEEAKRAKKGKTDAPVAATRETIETKIESGQQVGTDTVDMLTDAFEAMMDLFGIQDTQQATYFVLDHAIKKVPSEAGSVLFNDIGKRELYFVAARGAKSKDVIGRRIAIGKGIAGAAVSKGVSLAIPDVSQDARWDKTISESVSFETKSILCAPMFLEGRCYGALELINRTGSGSFTRRELSVVTYLAEQLARWLKRRGE